MAEFRLNGTVCDELYLNNTVIETGYLNGTEVFKAYRKSDYLFAIGSDASQDRYLWKISKSSLGVTGTVNLSTKYAELGYSASTVSNFRCIIVSPDGYIYVRIDAYVILKYDYNLNFINDYSFPINIYNTLGVNSSGSQIYFENSNFDIAILNSNMASSSVDATTAFNSVSDSPGMYSLYDNALYFCDSVKLAEWKTASDIYYGTTFGRGVVDAGNKYLYGFSGGQGISRFDKDTHAITYSGVTFNDNARDIALDLDNRAYLYIPLQAGADWGAGTSIIHKTTLAGAFSASCTNHPGSFNSIYRVQDGLDGNLYCFDAYAKEVSKFRKSDMSYLGISNLGGSGFTMADAVVGDDIMNWTYN